MVVSEPDSRPFVQILIRSAVVIAVVWVAGVAFVDAADTVTIQPDYRVGDRLHYSWHLENDLSWSPPSEGADWAKMTTDFDFTLLAKELDGDGGCLFDFSGTSLESIGEAEKGKLGVRATPTEARYLFGKTWTKPGPNTPLKTPMTVTLGPQFQPIASSGVESIALFLLPGVDPRVWFVVTTVPPGPLTVGHTWTQEFDVEIPGAQGDPLRVVIGIEVVGIEGLNGTMVVTLEAHGELNLTDSDLRMQDGRTLHVVHGRYEVDAVAKWDIDRGYLHFAEAIQSVKATADRPETMRLASEAVSRLSLQKMD